MEIEKISLLLTLATGLVGLFLQINQRLSDREERRKQLKQDDDRLQIERRRSDADTVVQTYESLLRSYQMIREELDASTARNMQLAAQVKELNAERQKVLESITPILDELETSCDPESSKRVRAWRQEYHA